MRVIVVEDEGRALRGLQNLIESISEEYEVIASVLDARKALELIVTLKPDAVFTDIQMPYMTGLQLIEAVRKYNTNTKFVITSAYTEFEYAKKALSLEVVDYLLKPVTYDEVEIIMDKLSKDDIGKTINKRNEDVKRYPDAHLLIQKAISMIEVSYATKLSQEDLANQLGMTQEYFSYLFHKEIGIKFSDYIRNCRINVAKKLLIEQNMKINEVASAVGYSDTKYFSKIFRKVENKTPTEYVRKFKY
ncbi:MAG: helix-turn-helix domain-containing protein [Lachnospirales bacterium]